MKSQTQNSRSRGSVAPIQSAPAPVASPIVPIPAPVQAVAQAIVAAVAEVGATATTKEQKTFSSTLRGSGPTEGHEMIVTTYKVKGGWRTEANHYTERATKDGPRRKGARGATQTFTGGDAFKQADAFRSKLVDILKGKGWTKADFKPLGLERKPDVFDLSSLPSAK